MKTARYWTRAKGEALSPSGDRIEVTARGWSNDSIHGALQLARETAQRVASAIASGETKSAKYLYGDRPLPEPVIQEFGGTGEDAGAITTRNAYGALVLNSRDMMFVDIDRDESQDRPSAAGLIEGILSLFGSKSAAPVPKESPIVGEVRRVADRHNLGVRLYKTAGGYRAIITNRSFEAGSAESESLLKEFGCDPVYVHLCRMQESFRARLSPKPWRCGSRTPPVRFPFETDRDQAAYRKWESMYSAKASSFSTCQFVTSVGSAVSSSVLSELITFHDDQTKAFSGLPLA